MSYSEAGFYPGWQAGLAHLSDKDPPAHLSDKDPPAQAGPARLWTRIPRLRLRVEDNTAVSRGEDGGPGQDAGNWERSGQTGRHGGEGLRGPECNGGG